MRAGKGHFIDIRMGCQGSAGGLAVPWDDVDYTLRDASLQEEFPKAQGRQRGFFRRLEHHRTSGCQGWSHFPNGGTQWTVQWDDGTDNPHGFLEGVRYIVARQRVFNLFAMQLDRHAGVVAQ